MRVTTLRIENFRGIKRLDLDLDELTVLIGENNTGKTAVLDALKICLRDIGPRRRVVFNALDFHLAEAASEPADADPIRIEATFSEQTAGEWSDALVGRLGRDSVLQVDDAGLNYVILCVTCEYDAASRDFAQDWSFLNLDGQPLPRVGERALATLQREVSYFYLQALRNAQYHFGDTGPFWRPFLKDAQLPDEKRVEIEVKLREVNELVVNSHDSFERVHDGLRRLQDVVPLAAGDVVSVEAVPGRIFDMLAKARVNLGTMDGAKIPVECHGEGTQSLAVLMLFTAFLEAWPEGDPIVALEEPEAHLHPSAIRTLQRLVQGFSGQKLISTHSGDLLGETEIHQIRRLARTKDGIRAFRVPAGLLSGEETRKFNYHVRQARGELLFARCWLLVEGETECWIFPGAARALDIDLDRAGVRTVTYKHSGVGLLAKIANALGIAWYCVGDGDGEEKQTKRALRGHMGSAEEKDRMMFPYENIEIHLLQNGYENVYERFMPEQNRAKMETSPGDPGYAREYAERVKNYKTRAAAAVAVAMEERGEDGVTAEIRDVLNRAVSLARGA